MPSRTSLGRAQAAATALVVMLAVSPVVSAGRAPGTPPWGLGRSKAADVQVALITFGPGDRVVSYFGHNALVVQDVQRRVSRLYNFGMFGFSSDTLLNYLQGRLDFWVGVRGVGRTFAHYEATNREIVLQSLDLTPEQALALAEGLEVAALPENREYRYHHYQDNCSTKVRDHLDRVLGGRLREAGKASARFTLRGHTRRHSGRQPVVDFALRFWMNASMEAPITVWEEMFLPGELARVVESIGVARATQRVFEPVDRPPIPEAPPTHGPYLFLVGLLLGGLAWFLGVRRDRARGWRVALGLTHSLTGLAFGFLGTLGTLMWAFTEWDVTFDNANQLLANPLTLAAFPLGVGLAFGRMGGAGGVPGRAERWLSRSWTILAGTSILALLLAVLTITGQANGAVIALLLPMNLGFALSLRPTDTSVLPASAKSPEEAAPEPPSLA